MTKVPLWVHMVVGVPKALELRVKDKARKLMVNRRLQTSMVSAVNVILELPLPDLISFKGKTCSRKAMVLLAVHSRLHHALAILLLLLAHLHPV